MSGVLKPYKGAGRLKSLGRNATRGAKNAYHNKTNKSAFNIEEGRNFGEGQKLDAGKMRSNRITFGYGAALGGTAVGLGAGTAIGAHKHPDSRKKAFNEAAGITKRAPVYTITDLGTRAAKTRKHPYLPKKVIAGVGGGAAALTTTGVIGERKERAKFVQQQRVAKAEKVRSDIPKSQRWDTGFPDMGAKARVQHEAKQNYKFKGPHGKENVKIQAQSTGVGTAIGGAAGLTVGRKVAHTEHALRSMGLTVKPKAKMVGGLATAGGALYGTAVGQMRRSVRSGNRAVNAGYKRGDVKIANKKQGEYVAPGGLIRKSAFGVEHGS